MLEHHFPAWSFLHVLAVWIIARAAHGTPTCAVLTPPVHGMWLKDRWHRECSQHQRFGIAPGGVWGAG